MDLTNYTIKDFVLNESFLKWILEPDEGSRDFWEKWLNANPDKTDLITAARSMVLSIKGVNEKKLTHEQDEVWEMISRSIHQSNRDSAINIKEIQSK